MREDLWQKNMGKGNPEGVFYADQGKVWEF